MFAFPVKNAVVEKMHQQGSAVLVQICMPTKCTGKENIFTADKTACEAKWLMLNAHCAKMQTRFA